MLVMSPVPFTSMLRYLFVFLSFLTFQPAFAQSWEEAAVVWEDLKVPDSEALQSVRDACEKAIYPDRIIAFGQAYYEYGLFFEQAIPEWAYWIATLSTEEKTEEEELAVERRMKEDARRLFGSVQTNLSIAQKTLRLKERMDQVLLVRKAAIELAIFMKQMLETVAWNVPPDLFDQYKEFASDYLGGQEPATLLRQAERVEAAVLVESKQVHVATQRDLALAACNAAMQYVYGLFEARPGFDQYAQADKVQNLRDLVNLAQRTRNSIKLYRSYLACDPDEADTFLQFVELIKEVDAVPSAQKVIALAQIAKLLQPSEESMQAQ